MENLEIYEKVRAVPKNAQTPIDAGRLKGMTDINPMWRIKVLTELFGPCGIGWYYTIDDTWESVPKDTSDKRSDEKIANVRISLYIKVDGEWSKPIPGVGGSKISAQETKGLYVDDEAYKKAQTDALSVACKNLGIGADVYWDKDSDKYVDPKKKNFNAENSPSMLEESAETWQKKITAYASAHSMTTEEICRDYHVGKHSSAQKLKEVYEDLTSKSTAVSKASTDSEQESMPDFEAIDEPVPFK